MIFKKLHTNPLMLFWYPIPVVIIIGLILNGSLGIQLQETLIETTSFKFALFVSGFMLFSGLLYFMAKEENTIQGFTNTHINLSLVGLVILIILVLLQDNSAFKNNFDYYFRIDPREWLVMLLFGFGLIVYFINGAIALFVSLKLFGS